MMRLLLLIIFIILSMFLFLYRARPVYAVTAAPEEKFIWVARIHDQFSEDQYQNLANGFDIVVIANPHDSYKLNSVHEAALRLVDLNPAIKVFPYWSISKIFTYEEEEFINLGFNKDDWYLRDTLGNKVKFRGSDKQFYVDLANAAFRNWAINTIERWLEDYPYAGIAFDETGPINEQAIISAIGTTKIAAWNNGRKQLLRAAKQRFSNKIILFNAGEIIGQMTDDQKSLLETSDMILNEHFCFMGIKPPGNLRSEAGLISDINTQLLIANQGKTILQKTNYGKSLITAAEINKMGRYCYGAFLLGYIPGHAYFKYGPAYYIDSPNFGNELEANALEIDVPLGNPAVGVYGSGEPEHVYRRKFTNGWVYVNMSANESKTIILPEQLTLMNGGVAENTYQQGQSLNIPANDAVFLVKTLPMLIPGDIINTGDIPGDEVNINDYNQLIADFGKTDANGWIPADIIKNGTVDIFDYNILVGNYGK